METRTESKEKPKCSWCSKSQDDVAALIPTPTDKPGPRSYICDECVAVCDYLLAERGFVNFGKSSDFFANSAYSTNTAIAVQEGAIQ
jgi:ATP-dependent protease Clp ATPase subunit